MLIFFKSDASEGENENSVTVLMGRVVLIRILLRSFEWLSNGKCGNIDDSLALLMISLGYSLALKSPESTLFRAVSGEVTLSIIYLHPIPINYSTNLIPDCNGSWEYS